MENTGEEVLIYRWEEPAVAANPLTSRAKLKVFGGSLVAAALFVFLAYWQKEFSFYFAAVGAVIAAFALNTQSKQEIISHEVALTSARLLVGDKEYKIADLSGFWLEHDNNRLMVNVEQKKRTLLPISFAFESEDADSARAVFTQALPELEISSSAVSSAVTRYFRF